MLRLITLLILLTAACATAPAATPTADQAAAAVATDVPTAVPATDVPVQPTAQPPTAIPPTSAQLTDVPAEPTMEPTAQPAVSLPAWQEVALTNARTGESFTLADFAGKTVFVEPMATWCPICFSQQQQVTSVFNDLGAAGDTVFVSISVGENISDADLASYADGAGFGWLFAIAPPEMLSALADAFGRGALSPPSTPHFVIYPDGSHSDLKTGTESADDLRAALTSA